MQNKTDTDLILLAQEKKANSTAGAEAVGELYDRYHDLVFRYIWSRVSDKHLAEDLTGEVFTRMVIHLPKYRHTGTPFQAWLLSIARNLVIDEHRKASSRKQLPLENVEDIRTDEQGPAAIVENQIFIEQIQNALKELKPIKQDILVLRFIVGLSLQDVAAILKKTTGSIKVTQHRALNDLRTILETQSGKDYE